jgi:Cytochrome c554 and c-prime
MVKDDQHPPAGRGPAWKLTALALTTFAVGAGVAVLMGCWPRPPQTDTEPPLGQADEALSIPAKYFRHWPRPDLALILSGEQNGYLQPCGCSRPQYGGLARRYNFLRVLQQEFRRPPQKEKGWPILAVDLGDIAPPPGGATLRSQSMLKYKTSMEALAYMGYLGVGLGQNELAYTLFDVLGQYALNNERPRLVAANFANKDFKQFVPPYVAWGGQGSSPSVGVVGAVAKSVLDTTNDPDARFEPYQQVLPGVLQELRQKAQPELLVLLFQGTLAEAKDCAAQFPQFHVILCKTAEEEPSGQPAHAPNAPNTLIVGIGHKGRYVGVVGVNRKPGANPPFEFRYEIVSLGEEFETPPGQDATNPIIHEVMEKYAAEVKKNNFLARWPRTPHPVQLQYKDAVYVGSEKCKKCHESAYQVWRKKDEQGRSHSVAYHSLETATRPSLQQYDPECVRCHVVGLGHLKGFQDEKTTPHLKDVGCEVCHGPGSPHLKDNYDAELAKLMNPFKPAEKETPEQRQRRMLNLNDFCRKCHDFDNDVDWKIEKWEKIAHPEPKPNAGGE